MTQKRILKSEHCARDGRQGPGAAPDQYRYGSLSARAGTIARVTWLSEHTAVVTGGAQGIGLAMARRFAAAGMNLVLIDHDSEALEAATAAVAAAGRGPEGVLGVRADVTSVGDLQSVREQALARFGTASLLLANAGVALPKMPLWDINTAAWRWISDINITGAMNTIATFVPSMLDLGQGHVVITSSLAGLTSGRRLGGYTITKHALVGLGKALRADLAETGIGVSLLCPGRVPTNLTRTSARSWPDSAPRPDNLEQERHAPGVTEVDADTLADMVHDAVLAGRFWIATHPDSLGDIKEGQRELAEDFAAASLWLAGRTA